MDIEIFPPFNFAVTSDQHLYSLKCIVINLIHSLIIVITCG